MKNLPIFALLVASIGAQPFLTRIAAAATEVTNAATLRNQLGLGAYAPTPSALAAIKIAVLDNGFAGFAPGRGLLPESATFVAGPGNPQGPTSHGLGMAQIAWAISGRSAEGPRFYLVNANGFTNFKAAVDFVVREHVDIVLYSQVWPFGGNFDGQGFINAAVSRATQAGILWINAAGNFGGMVHEGAISSQRDSATGLIRFGADDHLVFENRIDENEVSVTLSWTDFQDSESYNTTKDLNLFVYDSQERLIGSSELIQRGEAPPASGDSQLSSHAREALKLRMLDRGTYRIRVRDQSGNFVSSDRFRVLLETEKSGTITLAKRTPQAEIFPPADHPDTLTVGEDFEISSQGVTADGRKKPDVLLHDAIVTFSNGATVRGSSTAAALMAGTVSILKAQRPGLSSRQILDYARNLQSPPNNSDGLTVASPTAWPPLPQEVTDLVPNGGRLMIHPNGHFVVLSPVDPFTFPPFNVIGARPLHPDEVLAYLPSSGRWMTVHKSLASNIRSPWVEFNRMTQSFGPGTWRTPTPAELARW